MNHLNQKRLTTYLSGDTTDGANLTHPDGSVCHARTRESCPFVRKGDHADDLTHTGSLKQTTPALPEGIAIEPADVTQFDGDAVINAGNRWMIRGGGVDGAMHRAAGPALLEQCNQLPADANGFKIDTGDCKLLDGGNLPASHILYTVGPDVRHYVTPSPQTPRDGFGNPIIRPDWSQVSPENQQVCRDLLRKAYRSCFDTAAKNGLKSIATPSLSTGIFGFPLHEAAPIFAEESLRFVRGGHGRSVKMCLFNPNPEQLQKDIDLFKKQY